MESILNLLTSNPSSMHITHTQVLLSLSVAFVLTRVIIFSYHRIVADPLPPQNIANHITLIALITTLIIIPISTNAVLSLGMVGALSVVRFRTAIKSPTDTAYVYWALAVGISLGAQFYMPAIIGTFFLAFVMEINRLLTRKEVEKFIMNLQFDTSNEEQVHQVVKNQAKVLSVIHRENIAYLCLEVNSLEAAKEINNIEFLIQSETISYKGDFIQ